MKITDILSHIQKGGAGSETGKAAPLIKPVQPVGQAGKLQLVPGQLLQGEVVGEDVHGQVLLRLAGEIISARTPVSLEVGEQLWFEVREAGDTPLLALAARKGAVQELLRDIMALRPLLVKAASSPPAGAQPPASTSAAEPGQKPPPFQGAAPQSGSAVPAAAAEAASPPAPVLAADGTLPPEAARLIRALALYDQGTPQTAPGGADKGDAARPLGLIKAISAMIRQGTIPPELRETAAFQGVIRPQEAPLSAAPSGSTGSGAAPSMAEEGRLAEAPPGVAGQAGRLAAAISGESTTPRLAPQTIRVLSALVAVAGVKMGSGGQVQPVLDPEQNLAEMISQISRADKIPLPLQKLGPLQVLMGDVLPGGDAGQESGAWQRLSLAATELGTPEALAAARQALPLQFVAAQQGADPLPSQLRLLASLMGLGAKSVVEEGRQEIETMFSRLVEGQRPEVAAKLASFFEGHARVNGEAAPSGQANFYLIPSLFTGQTGWGEWLWSREQSTDNPEAGGQENLLFFLEMSNLGALTIQVMLQDKKIRGQIAMADKEGSLLVEALLPELQERLEAFGYQVMDFSCTCQPLNIMQELKEKLQQQAGAAPVSLLDIKA